MSLVANIARAWVAPRAAFRAELARLSEPRNLMLVMLVCVLSFVSRLPEIAALSHLAGDDAATAQARYGAMFVSTVLMAPLMLYALAGLVHAVLIPLGGRGSWGAARLALFWAALVVSPLVLVTGAAKVFAPGTPHAILLLLSAVVFLWQWAVCLRDVEFGTSQQVA